MSTWLGIDIGTTAVKVAAVRSAYRKVQLVGLASVEVAQAGGVVEALSAAARAAVGEQGGVGDAIAIAVEGQRATVKIIGLPSSAMKSVGEVLPFELESSLPFDIDEAVFDYRLLPKLRDVKGEELAVLVGVAKTADVLARIDLVKGALATEPERVGVGAFPIASMVPYVPGLAEGVVTIVDLGTVSSDVLILTNGEPTFARTLGLGTKGLPGTAAKLARELRTTIAAHRSQGGEAPTRLYLCGGGAYVAGAAKGLPGTAAKLARELRTTIAAHRSQGGEAPTRLYLCGGGAYVSGAEAFLSSALELPVETLPTAALEVPTALAPEHTATMARFAKAIGLALALGPRSIGLNLRRGPLAFERGFAWIKEKVPVLAGLAAVILVSFLFSAWAQLHAKSKEKVVLEKALATVTKEVLGEETQSASRASELLTSQTTLADEDPLPHADAFDVMVKLSELIPPSMTHDIEELDVQKQHVIVHGIVGTIPDAQAIRSSIADERCFSDAKITRTNAQVGGTNQKYVLEFDIKCPEDVKGSAKKPGAAASSSASAPAGTGGK